jgi:uncharacterized RDD family membrane protein YckC
MRNEYRVLTPESVEFVYELGGLGSRMMAVILDHLIIVAVLGAIWIVALTIGVFSALILLPGMAALALLSVFLVNYGYFTYFEWKWNGQTPGKRAMDLRVIDARGMNIDLFQALIRNLFRVIDMTPLFYAFGGIAALLNPNQKRLGDWAAGTLVVRTRKRVMPGAIIAPNEKYNSLLEDASLRNRIRSRLSLQERETLLQLCLRRNELEIDPRQELFADAAAYLEERLELRREPFLSEEKFVQNIAAVALAEQDSRASLTASRTPHAARR